MRVVFLAQDSLPNGRVGPDHTPTLWRLITEEGGWAPGGGRSVLASSTYPNHASFATGADVTGHRIFTNDVWHEASSSFVCSSTVDPMVETIFHAARRAGISTSAVLGDQTMVGSMAAPEADIHWPPHGVRPDGAATDSLGYMANSAVLDAIDTLEALEADLSFVHFNEPDSAMHLFGPDAPETLDQIRANDSDLAALVDRLRPRWDQTVLFVVSDHEQEAVDREQQPVDLVAELHDAGLPGSAHNEGMVGLVVDGPGAEAVKRLTPIADTIDLQVGVTIAWSSPGRPFGAAKKSAAGQHGSPRTMTQVAAVAGGHPLVAPLADSLDRRAPHATDWAPTLARLFDFDLPAASGTSLLGG